MEQKNENQVMVTVKCLTYNHKAYLRQCLEGFVMQKTNFRFEAVVHDDASTDGTIEILREFAEKYPDIIKPIYEVENQYSKHNGEIRRKINELTHGKYIAICEGDDYWIDPLKLQKQVDFMESHPDYSMCCSDALILTDGKVVDFSRSKNDFTISMEDLILLGGGAVMTATLLFRAELLADYPDCCKKCHVGDYPLQLYMGLQGKVFYFAEKMSAYRFAMGNSWTKTFQKQTIEKQVRGWRSEIDMLDGLNHLSDGKYDSIFEKRKVEYLFPMIYENRQFYNEIQQGLKGVSVKYSICQSTQLLMIKMGLFPIAWVLNKIHHRHKKNVTSLKRLPGKIKRLFS